MRTIRSIIADLGYMLDNIREFGFSIRMIKEDFEYMIDNLRDPLRENVQ